MVLLLRTYFSCSRFFLLLQKYFTVADSCLLLQTCFYCCGQFFYFLFTFFLLLQLHFYYRSIWQFGATVDSAEKMANIPLGQPYMI